MELHISLQRLGVVKKRVGFSEDVDKELTASSTTNYISLNDLIPVNSSALASFQYLNMHRLLPYLCLCGENARMLLY